KVLLESQGYSIECKRKEREIIKKQKNSNDENLSKEDKIIFGTENVFFAAISLLKIAANQKCKKNSTIYITYNNLEIANHLYNKLIYCCRKFLLKAINNGWNVLFLLRLNNNTNRTIEFINFAKPLIMTGKFNPYYINKYDSSAIGKECIIVPGIGTLSCFSTKPNLEIDCAFYLRNTFASDIFKNYYLALISNYAQPLVKYYANEKIINYSNYVIESEENIGSRFLYKYCFSVLTLPEKLYEKLLKKRNLSNDEILIALAFYKKRLSAFLTNIQNYEYNDIYLADSIKDLIKHRRYYFYSYAGIEMISLETQDIINFLLNIINLLETYANYNIAFIPSTVSTTNSENYYCMVKERHAVFLEIFESSKTIPKMRLSIKEPMLIKAFQEYFKEIWEQIAPVNKDKQEIISWIQSQINLLQK
ncbi:MAG: XRE family transcriptional regulator, partial [Tissierellia bacterium]|nr:XRE family transcriptional regulator [Tissierellia bacterium]